MRKRCSETAFTSRLLSTTTQIFLFRVDHPADPGRKFVAQGDVDRAGNMTARKGENRTRVNDDRFFLFLRGLEILRLERF